MKKLRGKRIVAFILAASLAAGFGTAPAQAASKKKTVYVVTGEYSGKKAVKKALSRSFSYKKTGLLKGFQRSNGIVRGEYKYDKQNRLVQYRQCLNQWATFDYTYNKKGQLKGINGYYTYMADNTFAYDGMKTTYTYNSKGQVSKEVTRGKEYDDTSGKAKPVTYTIRFAYNKKGQVIKRTETRKQGKNTYKGTCSIQYDKHGNEVKYIDDNGTTTWAYQYDKKGNVTRKTETYADGSQATWVYKYKKISVDAALADAVKDQQKSLINSNWFFTVPVNSYNGM